MRRAAGFRLAGGLAFAAATGHAATRGPPVFVPGLYQTESRNSAVRDEAGPRIECIAAVDFEAFRRATIARYLQQPQFAKICTLSATRPTADGFAFAMDCDGARSVIAFHVARGFVSSTTRTRIDARPDYDSTILTLSRRIGACPGASRGDGHAGDERR